MSELPQIKLVEPLDIMGPYIQRVRELGYTIRKHLAHYRKRKPRVSPTKDNRIQSYVGIAK